MLMESLRNATQSRVGKVFMTLILGVIIVSFVFWGIADVFRGFSTNTVASVGGQTVTTQQFGALFRRTLYDYQQRAKGNLSAAQARAMGLDRQVLERMTADAALDDRAASLRLGVSDAAIAEAIFKEPSLQDAKGQFSKDKFDQALRNQGIGEREFDAEQRKSNLRRQIGAALAVDLRPPKALVEALGQAEEQARSIDYFLLPQGAAGEIAAPGPDVLKAYYEANKANYRAKEYRSLNLLAATPAALAKPGEVSDEDAKASYEKEKDAKFTVPESRKLQQIVFANDGEAAEALAKIKGGASFDDIVRDRKLKDADIELGDGPKATFFDPALADAGFALPEGGTSEVVKGKFGPAILRASAIRPASVKTFEDSAAAIKEQLARSRAATEIQGLHDRIEDARVSGKPLAEAAKAAGLETRAIASVDAQGNDPSGAKVGGPELAQALRAAFASDVGADDAAIATKDNGYVWFEVTKIEPAHDRPLEEVKDAVEKQWRAEEATKALGAKAADLVKQLNAGASLASLAQGVGAEVKSAAGLRRAGGGELPPSVAPTLFATPPDGANAAAVAGGQLIFKITADATPPIDLAAQKYKAMADALGDGLGNDLMSQYIKSLQRSLGVKVDERAMVAAEGG